MVSSKRNMKAVIWNWEQQWQGNSSQSKWSRPELGKRISSWGADVGKSSWWSSTEELWESGACKQSCVAYAADNVPSWLNHAPKSCRAITLFADFLKLSPSFSSHQKQSTTFYTIDPIACYPDKQREYIRFYLLLSHCRRDCFAPSICEHWGNWAFLLSSQVSLHTMLQHGWATDQDLDLDHMRGGQRQLSQPLPEQHQWGKNHSGIETQWQGQLRINNYSLWFNKSGKWPLQLVPHHPLLWQDSI